MLNTSPKVLTTIKGKGTMHKEVREIVRQLEANGYSVEQTKGGHLAVRNAQGNRVYTMPSTPGGGRWKKNLLAELKRKGLL
jgi:predicted RNA binding protein YcfA (HicA-like mRNA interferase family)